MTPADTSDLLALLRARLPAWPWEARDGGGIIADRADLGIWAVVSSKGVPVVGERCVWTLLLGERRDARRPAGRGWRHRVVEMMAQRVQHAEDFVARAVRP